MRSLALAGLLALGAFASPAAAQDGRADAPAPSAEAAARDALIAAQKPAYPLSTCVVSGEPLGTPDMGPPVEHVVDGRLVIVCCKACIKGVEQDKAAVFKTLDAAVLAAQQADYPLGSCPVSDEPLPGEPKWVVSGTKLVGLCCNGCKKDFAADPAPIVAKVDAAWIAKQGKDYPLDSCLVSGERIEGAPLEHLHGTTLTRFCCKNCLKEFLAAPAEGLAKLAAARAARRPAAAPEGADAAPPSAGG